MLAPARQKLAIQVEDADAVVAFGDVYVVVLVDVEIVGAVQVRPLALVIALRIEDLEASVLAVQDQKAVAAVHAQAVGQGELARPCALLSPRVQQRPVGGEAMHAELAVSV